MFLAAKEFPLPLEYRFLPLTDVFHEPPADVEDRTLVFLDCGNIDRMPVDFLQRDGAHILNIDHHHDNTLFGTVNLVDTEAPPPPRSSGASRSCSTCVITPETATALYVGLVTDTGQVHVREHGPGLAPDGRRADRGRRQRRRDLPAPIRAGPDREGEARRPSDREDRTLRRTASRLPTSRARTTRPPGRPTSDRGDHRPRSRARGHGRGGGHPRQDRRRAHGAEGQPALLRRHRRRLDHRPGAGGRRTYARRRLRHRPRPTRRSSSSCASRVAKQLG